ncbi:MAG: excinuclease ABC subunit UvrC [Rikenellaceae bacterium]
MGSIKDKLKELVGQLPHSPGIYQYLDKSGSVIYVGKAKDLRKRVSSYFIEGQNQSAKVQVMVKRICDIHHIVVDSESDALLLENSLIKTLQPRYNILLKDDKSYPWIVVRRENFPRVLSTRQLVRDGSQYFGPYSSVAMQRAVLEVIREVVPLRTCKLNLSPEAINRGKYSVCLQYHIGNCLAPCVGQQSQAEYDAHISLVVDMLKGDLRSVRKYLNSKMLDCAEALKFEDAQRYKRRLESLDNYSHRSVIVSSKLVDVDTFSLVVDDDVAFCNYIKIRHGSVVAIYTQQITPGVDSTPEELLRAGVLHIMENIVNGLSREIIVPMLPAPCVEFDGLVFTIPKRGEKLDLLQFSQRSARLYRAEQLKNMEIKDPSRHANRIMAAMKRELYLKAEPRHIECFDNSNHQGTNPVASCVVFRDGKPSKREYRHFNVKSVVGADDFASMREIVYRRYRRLLDEGEPLPNLIVVDGGKGQLSSAYGVLCELGVEGDVEIVGLAKRIEEVFFPGDSEPYYLSKTGEPLKVLCHIRDEAHRFGITFHRQKRSENFIKSELDSIPTIGAKRVAALLQHFKTVSKVKAASLEELTEVVGAKSATAIRNHFDGAEK